MAKEFDYEKYEKYRNVYNNTENLGIKSDFSLILSLLWDILKYIILFIPNLIIIILMFLIGHTETKEKFSRFITEPFRLFKKISDWFFQAKYTAYIILSLTTAFIIQIIFINTNPTLLQSLMTHPYHIYEGNFHSMITSVFLHADPLHLGTNLLALLIFGRIVEKHFGYKVLFVFLIGGIFSNFVSNLIWEFLADPEYSLGASGAIASLIIFAILLEPLAMTTVFLIPLPIFLIGWFLIFLDITGISRGETNVNHFAHLAGYLALLVAFFFIEFKHRKKIFLGLAINIGFMFIIYSVLKIYGINLPI